jgi:hypothetical protein
MADRTITVLTPAVDTDLLTLQEAKQLMGLSLADTSDDAQLQLFIDINSEMVARYCNRVFARHCARNGATWDASSRGLDTTTPTTCPITPAWR